MAIGSRSRSLFAWRSGLAGVGPSWLASPGT